VMHQEALSTDPSTWDQPVMTARVLHPAHRLPTVVLVPALVVAMLAAPARGFGQNRDSARDQLVVSASWLVTHLHDPDLVLLQVGDTAQFQTAHIPGARAVSLADVSAGMSGPMDMDHRLVLEMLPPDTLRTRLEGLGISDRSHVVVYFTTDEVSPTTRVLYTLTYAGLDRSAALLDGGLPAWRAAGAPLATGPATAVHPGVITARAQLWLVVDADWVHTHAGRRGIALLDARKESFYDGSQPDDGPRRGHIPGARSLPFEELYDDHEQLRSPDALQARFRQAGVLPGDTVVAYCHIGQRATAVLLAARTLGYPVRLYDGSFQDWGRRADLAVDNPSAGAAK
jgi:thiosulfate/3-mercaptopyruvate sulfurtransferase